MGPLPMMSTDLMLLSFGIIQMEDRLIDLGLNWGKVMVFIQQSKHEIPNHLIFILRLEKLKTRSLEKENFCIFKIQTKYIQR